MRLLGWLKRGQVRDSSFSANPGNGVEGAISPSPGAASSRLTRAFASLALPNFRVLWIGMLFSMAAMQVNIVSRSWLAYDISGSALALGLVAMARGLPQLALSPIAGVAADRFDKRKVLVAAQSGVGLLALLNAVLVHLGVIQIWHLVAIGLFQGMVFPFTMPARQAYIPELVGEDRLPNALAIDSAGRNLNRVLAPSLAGLLIAWHPTIAFYAVAVLYLSSAFTMWHLPPARRAAAGGKSIREEMMIGFRYILGHRLLRVFIIMGFLAVTLGLPFQPLLPVFQVDVLHVGPAQLGLMYTMIGIGAIVGSLLVAYRSDDPRKRLFQLIAGVAFGTILMPFALSTSYSVSLILLALIGLASEVYLTLNRILVLLNTDSRLYGRVMGVYMMTWSLMPVATLPMGALVDTFGAPHTVAVAGALLAASTLVLAMIVVSPI